MNRQLLTSLLLLVASTMTCYSQNIYSALHHSDESGYKYGRPVQVTETNTFYTSHGLQVEKNVKSYDPSGMIVTEVRYDEAGTLEAKLTYVNDTARRLVLSRIIERRSKLDAYSKETAMYIYDANGFLIRVTDVDAAGNTIQVSILVNNEKGNPVSLTLYDGSGNSYGVERAEYFYNRNKVVTTVYSNDGRKLSTDSITFRFHPEDSTITDKSRFNEHGDALSYTSRNLNGTETLYEEEYTYDATGNCTEEKTYKVTVKSNGKKKRTLDRDLVRQFVYR